MSENGQFWQSNILAYDLCHRRHVGHVRCAGRVVVGKVTAGEVIGLVKEADLTREMAPGTETGGGK